MKPFIIAAPVLPELRLEYLASRPSHRTISISDLSVDGRSNFQLALSYYKVQKDLYDGEREADLDDENSCFQLRAGALIIQAVVWKAERASQYERTKLPKDFEIQIGVFLI
jgi:hypothetical protein